MNSDERTAAMRALVADSLAVPLAEVTLDSRLIDDLGADSLDFVDIIFQIEKKFGVKIQTKELAFLGGLDFSSPEVMRNGLLTPQTIERLKEWVPALGSAPDPSRVTPAQLFSMISVATFVRLVDKKLAGAGAS